MFEAVEAALDAIAKLIGGAIVWSLYFAADLGWDDSFSADALDSGDDGVGVITALGYDDFSLTTCQQRQRFCKLTGLAACEPEGNGLPEPVGEQVNLVLSPPRERTMVESSIRYGFLWSAARSPNSRSHTPASAQRTNRLCTLLYLP